MESLHFVISFGSFGRAKFVLVKFDMTSIEVSGFCQPSFLKLYPPAIMIHGVFTEMRCKLIISCKDD